MTYKLKFILTVMVLGAVAGYFSYIIGGMLSVCLHG
jgi:hypothetical protein